MAMTGRGNVIAIVVHGGAGQWRADQLARSRSGIERALDAGLAVLNDSGGALDAVEAAVVVLEDDPVFNAGKGSHPNADGEIEMDAIVVDGSTQDFGAVAAIRNVRHPVSVARKVLDGTPHCILAGEGATRFARECGVPFAATADLVEPAPTHDTVGAVALDVQGRIAAATSTGGTRNKMPGRVGDAPIIGSGAYADGSCGVSATGQGEYIMRVMLSKSVADGISRGLSPETAAAAGIAKLEHIGGRGGVIVMDRTGNVAFARNTKAMPVAYLDGRGARHIGA
jgi:beta-aspartyl-peptidase (threonine type)